LRLNREEADVRFLVRCMTYSDGGRQHGVP